MKRSVFNVIISILLLIVSLAGLASGAFGGLECFALKKASATISDSVGEMSKMDDALTLLKEHEEEYLNGVEAVYTGDEKLLQGRAKVNQGAEELAKGRKMVADAQAQYDKYNAQLKDAKAQYAAAQAKMDEYRPQYEEGKEMVAKLQQIQPYVDTYARLKSGVLDNIPGFASVDVWFVTKVLPAIAGAGLELPSDIESFASYMDEQLATASSLLAQYEDAERQLADAKKQIDDAEKQMAEAKAQLDKGKSALSTGDSAVSYANSQLDEAAKLLEEGEAGLEEYDAAIETVKEAVITCLETESIVSSTGRVAVQGVAERLGDGFDIYMYNENGEVLALANGEARLDYDKCLQVSTALKDYMADYEKDLNREANLRIVLDAGIILLSILGILAAISSLRRKFRKAAQRGTVLFPALMALNVYGIVIGYAAFAHPQDQPTFQGLIPLLGLWLLTLTSLFFMISARRTFRLAGEEDPEDESEDDEEDEDAEDEDEDIAEDEPAEEPASEKDEPEIYIPNVANVDDELAAAQKAYEKALREYMEKYKK